MSVTMIIMKNKLINVFVKTLGMLCHPNILPTELGV